MAADLGWNGRCVRVRCPADVPPADGRVVDVAVLDMNHGWPNLGHDSLVHMLLDGDPLRLAAERRGGIKVRVLSYDVRLAGMVPEPPDAAGGRFAIYLGTGGPGHLDPRCNDGVVPESQGVHEDPAWEAPFFRLLDRIACDAGAALLAVCHSFGVMCRWAGVARPVLRGPEKGGKSSGVMENAWTAEAAAHPWFGRFTAPRPAADCIGPGPLPEDPAASRAACYGRLRILDSRLFDLVEEPRPLPAGALRIGYETLGVGGPPGDALTMMELARDAAGIMPRVFGVNHHPEVVDRVRQRWLLEDKVQRGEVSAEWAAERRRILSTDDPDEDTDRRLRRTSETTLLGPLRFFLYRQLRQRAADLGRSFDLHEDRVLREAAPVSP